MSSTTSRAAAARACRGCPPSEPTPSIALRFDGWILPKAGVAFVWVLEDEVVDATDDGHRVIDLDGTSSVRTRRLRGR